MGQGRPDDAGEPSPDLPPRDPRLEIPEVLRTPIPRPPERTKPPVMERWSDTALAWGLAMEFVATIIGGLVVGWLADRWASTAPALTITGLVIGFIAAFVRIIKQSAKANRRGPGAKDK